MRRVEHRCFLPSPGRADYNYLVLSRGRIAALAVLLGGCLSPTEPGTLQVLVRGAVYPRPRCTAGPAAMGTLYPRGEPVQGARVTLEPGGLAGTTDSDGRLQLVDVPEGRYTLRVSASTFGSPEAETVMIVAGKSSTLAINLDPCVFGGGGFRNVGFDKKVTLTAATFCGDDWEGASFTWTQVEGPDVRASVTSWNGQQLTFTTRKLEDVRPLPDAPQILSFSPDQAGQYVFQVIGRSKAGLVSKDYVLVTSTNVASGMNSVAPYNTFYFVGDKKGPWDWTIAQWPEGWTRALEGEKTRTPSVRLLPGGAVTAQQTVAIVNQVDGTTFALVVGNWDMVNRDCGRSGCHPPLQRSWEGTRHANTWRRLVDGELLSARSPNAAESCATCHSQGHDPGAPNGGYDDLAAIYGVAVPKERKKGSYARLPTPVQELSNVYCLSCHGPARVDPPVAEQPGRFAEGICAQCHDRLPEQDLVAQWRTSRMARTIRGELNGPESRDECATCHTAQGFYYENFALGRPPNPNVLVMNCCENLAPITCQTCHSPMYARNKAQLFAYDTVTSDSGLELQRVGSGAICVRCHNTGHDVSQPGVLVNRLAPHSPQADLSYGRGGYLIGPTDYPIPSGATCSSTAGDGCATCHMDEGPAYGEADHRKVGDHTFHMVSSEGVENTGPCQICHTGRTSFDPRARHDYDGSTKVESVRKEVDGLMALLKQRLETSIASRGYRGCAPQSSAGVFFKRGFAQRLVVVDAQGFDLGDCDRNGVIEREESPFLFPDADVLLHKAAYNYLFVQTDKSRGLHNLPYVVSLLQRSIHAVSGGKNLPDWDLFQKP